MYMGGQPIFILEKGTRRERGEDAHKNNISAANAVANAVRTTLGPKGMDKMLIDSVGDIVITNDGVTILKEMEIEHPAAKMMIEIAETQEEECGDGTTSAVVLAGELLKKADDLIGRIHASTISRGYRQASEKASEILEEMKIKIDIDDENILKNIASTAMTGKSIEINKEQLADIAVDAVRHIAEEKDGKYSADVKNIKIVKQEGASVDNTELVHGMILDKEKLNERMPKIVKEAKIALLKSALEVKKTKGKASIEIRDPEQLQRFIDEEEKSIKNMVEKIKKTGANVLFNQKDIDDLAQHYLAKEGIFAIDSISKSDMEKLSKTTGGNIVNNLNDLSKKDLGSAKDVAEKVLSGSHFTFIEGSKDMKAVSILLRGSTKHVVDELENAIMDALKVVAVTIEDGAVLPGGGATEIELSNRLKDFIGKIEGREQISFELFADSLDVIPRVIAENAGMDGIDVVMNLNTYHEKEGKKNFGIDVETGEVKDMFEAGIIEPFRVKNQAIKSAAEAANMILRIDDVIASKGAMGGPPEEEEY